MKNLKMAVGILTLGISSLALANTGTITINGKIYNETCILSASSNATGTKNIEVNLATISSSSFSESDRTSGKQDFSVSLTKANGTACYTKQALAASLAPVVTLSTSSPGDYDDSETTALVNKASTKSTTNPVFVQILAKSNSIGAGTLVDYSNTSTQAKATYDSASNKFYYS